MRKNIPVIALLFFIWCGYASAQPVMEVEPKEFSLGDLREGKVSRHELAIRNAGDEELRINPINVSCSCVQIVEPKSSFVLPPKQEGKVVFTFDTTGFRGEQKKYLFLSSNDPQRQNVRMRITANIKDSPQSFLERFKSFTFSAILVAGLADGFNPCAFTVLVFFVSFLAFVGYRKREMVAVGAMFILAVFLTYLLIGLGLFKVFMQAEVFGLFSKVIYILTGAIAIVLAAFSFYDAYIFKKTKDPERMKLKLPGLIKKQIHGVIRGGTDIRDDSPSCFRFLKFLIPAFVSGFLVTLLESVCTGQLYVPTIAYIFGMPELKARALAYLLLYNLMFILPLVGIFIFGVAGVTSSDFAKFARRHIFLVKVVTALVFLLLGSVLLIVR
ncbi:MAG: DUF1573 domain-containing protein [Candidatus Omnitrophica bacterium]|nr:DUF1573 domain-containing protein [Candidatus Omnitrophota bacterium]